MRNSESLGLAIFCRWALIHYIMIYTSVHMLEESQLSFQRKAYYIWWPMYSLVCWYATYILSIKLLFPLFNFYTHILCIICWTNTCEYSMTAVHILQRQTQILETIGFSKNFSEWPSQPLLYKLEECQTFWGSEPNHFDGQANFIAETPMCIHMQLGDRWQFRCTDFIKQHGRAKLNSLAIAGKISPVHVLDVYLVVHSRHLLEANLPLYHSTAVCAWLAACLVMQWSDS